MLIQALNRLGETFEFNATQCDLSWNQLTENLFHEINMALLSKMSRLTSLNLSENNIGAEGDRALRARFPFARLQHFDNHYLYGSIC